MAFQQALSGLNSAAKAIDATSHNIANSSTVGFKSSSAHFGDVYAASLNGAGASQIGIGVSMSAVQQQFTQGNLSSTNNPLDISINGAGFFRMDSNGAATYSRAGQFHLDKSGYVVNDQALKLTGYAASSGIIVPTTPSPIRISASDLSPIATGLSTTSGFTGVKANLNFDSRETKPDLAWTSPTATTITSAIRNSIFIAGGTSAAVAAAGGSALEAAAAASAAAAVYAAGGAAPGVGAAASAAVLNITPAPAGSAAAAAAAAAANTDAGDATDAAARAAAAAAVAVFQSGGSSTAAQTAAIAAATAAGGTAAEIAAAGSAAASSARSAFVPDPQSYNYSTALSVYDSLGNAHTLTMFFEKVEPPATPNTGEWRIHFTTDGTAESYVTGSGTTSLVFDSNGKLTSPADGSIDLSIDLANVMNALGGSNSATTPLAFTVDFTGSSQFGSSFGTTRLEQDGYAAGKLVGLSVGNDGVIQGRYSNGQSFAQGQIVLANFTNPNGLQSQGNNQWTETSLSGTALVGAPNTSSLGALSASTVEESNVDLTAELVNLITQQRNYQANAQSIKTQDQVMQTLVNLR